ncbi:S-adenosyl-L-methionine-dependent methyltransferase [Pleurotus eryngii]|uniref:S-adenosyl-L-methionine-dependent methyltransferase n=1 Tax=Pleurotus eryngii TaxID=5323 RepID=A0A9P6A4A7_PLEER|nr:S-adenosyl-L-methionine-dependent methyltransferase [Pleurotus eryngii]
MATFAKQSFNTSTYASFRPNYPRQLYDLIFKFHEHGTASPIAGTSSSNVKFPPCRWNRAVDLGCGTGQATTELTPFKRVTGVDPSEKMIEGARSSVAYLGLENSAQFDFVQSSAESLEFLEDSTVDLITAAQACHWFTWQKAWPEFARVLRPGGSAAFWVYSEFRFSRHPFLAPLITDYAQGKDPENSLGPYWQQPGRHILEDHLLAVPEPADILGAGVFAKLQRIYFTGDHYPLLPDPKLPVILRKRVTWTDLLAYLHTWSSLNTFQERYSSDAEHADGNIATRFWKSLKEGAAVSNDTDEVDIEFPLALLLVKKL